MTTFADRAEIAQIVEAIADDDPAQKFHALIADLPFQGQPQRGATAQRQHATPARASK